MRKWRQARVIPPRHWPAIMAATGLSLAELPGAPETRAETTMPQPTTAPDAVPDGATACLVLGDGSVFWGSGFGAHTPPAPPRSARSASTPA